LLKNGPLTDEEWEIMCQHPLYAYQLLKPIGFLEPALKIPYYHHERWDGSGYPAGLKGTDIPLEARIFAIVDVWDALSTDRPYRKAWSQDRVFEYLLAHEGSHFDPYVVEVFCKVMGREYVREKSTP
jgi:HD-GYP domain-containing protein (c-di-GMP phosphodiesterase class II)